MLRCFSPRNPEQCSYKSAPTVLIMRWTWALHDFADEALLRSRESGAKAPTEALGKSLVKLGLVRG